MSTSAKLSGATPVSTSATTAMVKLSGAKLYTASSAPVQATSVSTDVGTTTDHHLPNTPEQEYFPFEEEQEEKKDLQPVFQDVPSVLFDEALTVFSPVPSNLHEAMQNIGKYEANMETTGAVVKKSTKAFG